MLAGVPPEFDHRSLYQLWKKLQDGAWVESDDGKWELDPDIPTLVETADGEWKRDPGKQGWKVCDGSLASGLSP